MVAPIVVKVSNILLSPILAETSKVLLGKAKSVIYPSELEKALATAIEMVGANEARQNPPFWLMLTNKQQADFLSHFLEHQITQQELQKSIDQAELPDVTLLVEVAKSAIQSVGISISPAILERWTQSFVESYFDQVSASLRLKSAYKTYCYRLSRQCEMIQFHGYAIEGQDIERAEKLLEIFVIPKLQKEPEDTSSHRTFSADSQEDPKQISAEVKKIRADLLPISTTSARIVLLGAAGSGKSTLLRFFAVQAALQMSEEENQSPQLPILIDIRGLAKSPEMSTLAYARQTAEADLGIELPPDFFEYWLERGQALILFDGLDEVINSANQQKITAKINTFFGSYQRCSAIITSRPTGYRRDFFPHGKFVHYEIQPFDDQQIDEFIDRWYTNRALSAAEAQQQKTNIRHAIATNNRIRSLARTPILLTMIALIHRYQRYLPKERYVLYNKAVETLIKTWDASKELTNHLISEHWQLHDLRRLMERLAYWMHTQISDDNHKDGTLIHEKDLIDELSRYICEIKKVQRFQASEEAKQFLTLIVRDRAGLLQRQSSDQYTFVHKTFQEYLCAQEIIYQADNEDNFDIILNRLRDHMDDQHWREVILLIVAQQKPKKAVRAIRSILERGSRYEQWLHRDLFFAGYCLAECVNGIQDDSNLAQLILQSLVEIESSSQAGSAVRSEASKVLMSFSATAFQSQALALLK